ncbi:MAG TPA: DUF4232 domain-containing protein [Acidimicrobiales bacterium]|nr:DUF4232 domain-containing protein [Acidimicrobiales bacterium]
MTGPRPSPRSPDAVSSMVRRRVRRRRALRRLRITVLAVVITLAAGGAAFGIDRMVVSLHRYYAQPGPHHATSTTAAPPATTTTLPGPPPCVGGQLTGEVSNWREVSGTMFQTISLTNVSSALCSLTGYAGLAANSSNGTALPASTQKDASLGLTEDGPAASPAPVPVAPGTRAWFELAYQAHCAVVLQPGAGPTAEADACYAGSYLQVTPPSTASPVLVTEPLHFTYGTDGFQVGPFQPGPPPRSVPIAPSATTTTFPVGGTR